MSPPIRRAAFPVAVPKFVDHDHQRSKPRDISSALDVERLGMDLFRSTSLYLPYAARGVFGGQVISQSLVAATKSVTSELALHVSFV
jgi:acyl-CoA thioesterase